MDTCKGFGDSTPTCAPTEFCMTTTGIMDGGEFHDLNMNLYTCDNEMMNQISWPFKGNTYLHTKILYFEGHYFNLSGEAWASDICKQVGSGCHNFGNQTHGGVTMYNMEVCCCDSNL